MIAHAQPLLRVATTCRREFATVAGTMGPPLSLSIAGDVYPSLTFGALRAPTGPSEGVLRIFQRVVQSRVLLSTRLLHSSTYSSHLGSVARFCLLHGVPAIPAPPLVVVLYAAVCGSEVTL